MANQKHVELLLKGGKFWNEWRAAELEALEKGLKIATFAARGRKPHGLERAELSGSTLRYANLRNANLEDADLRGADLTEAELHDANLNHADLRDANLSGAILNQANLLYADLRDAILFNASLRSARIREARLTGAILQEANLLGAYLSRAYLNHTDLTGAKFDETVLADVDLTKAIGLEKCRHLGPSIIDFKTLIKSHPIPLEFLRGVGLPDNLIDYLPSLLNQPIQYHSCFISYSTVDDDFATRIHADLQNAGVRCWFAPHDLPIGSKIMDEIDTAIRLRDKILLVLSEHSIKSDWVEDEVKTGFEEERLRRRTVLFPVRLDDAIMDTKEAWAAKLRADRHIGDFRSWKAHDHYRKVFERVLRDLKLQA